LARPSTFNTMAKRSYTSLKSTDLLPTQLENVAILEERLSEPTDEVVETMRRLEGDIILLGVAGKMGPSLARMIVRASKIAGVRRRVFGASRFSDAAQFSTLREWGIETIRCDLLDERQVDQLPTVANVLYLAGMKFGATGNESQTWAMNAWLPAIVCTKFSRSRMVALSTGNIYGPAEVEHGGSSESDCLNPVGEYAMSCVGRERIFEHFSRTLGIPVAIVRLNYACDLRYGVLVDIAQSVWLSTPIDLATGYFNTIWQGDANAMILQSFNNVASPPWVVNVTGPELLSVRDVSQKLARLMGCEAILSGTESRTALLSDSRRARELFGEPRVNAEQLIAWAADWVMRGNPQLNKPTGFQSRDGTF
jgi:nucleoside-diphosphate-sugar epimerase